MKTSLLKLLFMAVITVIYPVDATAQINPKPPGKLIDIGGYKLHINCTGKGSPAIVLIAGAGDFSFDWSLVQPGVSRFARVCSYDRSGLAWSDLGPAPRTMKQESHELHALLKKAAVKSPYVLVGHSVGGLIARVYADLFPNEVSGMVLVDSTTEDTKLNYRGKIVRVRDAAKDRPIPPVQTMASSPPKPPTAEDLKQTEFNRQVFGLPKINAPFDKLTLDMRTLRLWALNNPKQSAASDDFWAEELQTMHLARLKAPLQLGDIPLVVIIGAKGGQTPPGVSADEWKQLSDEKRQQKTDLANLSKKGRVIIAEQSGHHIQLDEPNLVIGAVRQVVDAARYSSKLR